MTRLEVTLLLSLFGAFVFSFCGFASGDSNVGWCGLSLILLLGTMNVINLLLEIRNDLRRR